MDKNAQQPVFRQMGNDQYLRLSDDPSTGTIPPERIGETATNGCATTVNPLLGRGRCWRDSASHLSAARAYPTIFCNSILRWASHRSKSSGERTGLPRATCGATHTGESTRGTSGM